MDIKTEQGTGRVESLWRLLAVAAALVVSGSVIVLVIVVIIGIYKINPKRFRVRVSVTKWCSVSIEVDEPRGTFVKPPEMRKS